MAEKLKGLQKERFFISRRLKKGGATVTVLSKELEVGESTISDIKTSKGKVDNFCFHSG